MEKQTVDFKRGRKKDAISLICTMIVAMIISVFLGKFYKDSGNPIVTIAAFGGGIFVLIVGYFESRDNDPFVTGKTQTIGVLNSIVASGLVMILASIKFGSFIPSIVVAILLFISRDFGRKEREKKIDEYVFKNGIITDKQDEYRYTIDVNGKKINAFSKNELEKGDNIKVTELKGNYLYIEKA